eukprot:scaffold341933_cov20-Prasinocladus_malaysianus.AAC.1
MSSSAFFDAVMTFQRGAFRPMVRTQLGNLAPLNLYCLAHWHFIRPDSLGQTLFGQMHTDGTHGSPS